MFQKVYAKGKKIYGNRKAIKSSGQNIWKELMALKKLINVEKKFIDTGVIAVNPSNTGTNTILTNIAQGADYNQRNGNSIKLSSTYLKLIFANNPTSAATFLRVMMFIDNDNIGSAPAVTDVLEAASVVSPLNHTNGKRFKILSDKTLCASLQGPDIVKYNQYKMLSNHVKYSNATTGSREGQLYILLISDQSVNTPSVSYFVRSRFIDN